MNKFHEIIALRFIVKQCLYIRSSFHKYENRMSFTLISLNRHIYLLIQHLFFAEEEK